MTRNYRHFGALGVRTHTQGVDGVMAVAAINVGEMQVRVVVTLPAIPVRVAAAGMRWATDGNARSRPAGRTYVFHRRIPASAVVRGPGGRCQGTRMILPRADRPEDSASSMAAATSASG